MGKTILFVTLVSLWSSSWVQASGSQLIPYFFCFGDSISDVGTNSDRLTLARADYLPYGIDFKGGIPTGRFSNGRIYVDFLCELLGLEYCIPPFDFNLNEIQQNDSRPLQGVDYASGGATILATGLVVNVLTFDKQILAHKLVVDKLRAKGISSIQNLLRKSLYTVSIGVNDYIDLYIPLSATPDIFAAKVPGYTKTLIDNYREQIESLYDLGARKIALFGQLLFGCLPFIVDISNPSTKNFKCVDVANYAVMHFNTELVSLVDELNHRFTDAQFIFVNVSQFQLSTMPDFKVTNQSCCKTQYLISAPSCIPRTTPCNNRDEYYWWDKLHPSESVHMIIANRAYQSSTPNDTYPFGISDLVRL